MLDHRGTAGKQLHVAAFGRGCDGTTVLLSRENLHDEDRLRGDLAERFSADASLVDGLGAVSVIGAGINASYVNLRRGTKALDQAAIEARGLATSSFRISWLIRSAQVDEAVRRLHQEFVEANRQPVP